MWTTVLPLASEFFSASNLVPLAFVVLAVFLLMLSLRRKQRRMDQRAERDTPVREPPPVDKKNQLRRDMEALIVELQELSRRISAEIDMRFAKLEAVMHDADRRIAVLHRLTRQGAGQTQTDVQATQSDDPNDRHRIVYELADAGSSPVEIAKELGKTPGEIELILNLRKSSDKGLS